MEVSRGVVAFGGALEDYPFLIGLSRPQPLWVVGVVNSEGVVARECRDHILFNELGSLNKPSGNIFDCRSVTQFLHFGLSNLFIIFPCYALREYCY